MIKIYIDRIPRYDITKQNDTEQTFYITVAITKDTNGIEVKQMILTNTNFFRISP